MKTKLMMLATLLAMGLSGPAIAASCAPRDTVVDRLATKYGETRQSIGLGPNNAVVEVFASTTTGTWTITVTSAHGTTCLVASGQSFETLDEVLPIDGDDA